MELPDLTGAIFLELRHLRESADQIRVALVPGLPPIKAARTLVRLADTNKALNELADDLQDLADMT